MSTYQSKSKQPSFLEKYGIKHYLSILHITIVVILLELTCNTALALLFVVLFAVYGNIPIIFGKDDKNTQFSSYHNKNSNHVGPLIANCFGTIAFLIYIWYRYEDFCTTFGSCINTLIVYGFLTSINIDACHQLFHRNEFYCKAISYLTLIVHQFTTYPIQHLYTHHKLVGTLDDPVTSPKNQSLYAFYIKVIIASYKVNFNYSKKIFALCIVANFSYILILYFGSTNKEGLTDWNKVIFFISLSYFNLFLMEAIEYIEHYGLVYRTSTEKAPVKQICSWNTEYNPVSNWAVFKYQRHSDHHMNAYKIYTTLDLSENMPKLPFDFNTGLILSLIPSLWYEIANPLVDEVMQGKKRPAKYSQKLYKIQTVGKIVVFSSILIGVICSFF